MKTIRSFYRWADEFTDDVTGQTCNLIVQIFWTFLGVHLFLLPMYGIFAAFYFGFGPFFIITDVITAVPMIIIGVRLSDNASSRIRIRF